MKNNKINKKLGKNKIVEEIKVLSNEVSDSIDLRELTYFGEFLLFVDLMEKENIPTMGVKITKTNPLLVYNPDFVDKLERYDLIFILVHEVFHLLSDHGERIINNNLKHEIGNIAADMIINESIINSILTDNFIKNAPIIKDSLRKPKKYNGRMIFEELYHWVRKQKKHYDKSMTKIKGMQGQNNNNDGNTNKNQKRKEKIEKDLEGKIGKDMKKMFDKMKTGKQTTLDKHFNKLTDEGSKIPESFKKEIINNIKRNLKNRGFETKNITDILGNLKKSKKNYTKKIISGLERGFGIHNIKSFRRPNRRGIPGIKGPDSELKELNVLLDTSGSMTGYFEKALSFIFRNGITINLIQCDTKVHDNVKITGLSDFKKIMIHGRGGTMLQPGVDYIETNKKIRKNNLLVLTDGYTDSLSFSKKTKKVLILSNASKVGIKDSNKAKVEQIIIKDFDE